MSARTLSAAFSTRSRFVAKCTLSLLRDREDSSERGRTWRSSGRAVREINMAEHLQLLFSKNFSIAFFPIGGDGANNAADIRVYTFCDSSLWTHGVGWWDAISPSPLEIRFLLATSLLAEARDLSGNKGVVDGEVGRAERVDEFPRFPSTPFTSAIPRLTVLYASLSSSDHLAIIWRAQFRFVEGGCSKNAYSGKK